LLSKILFYLLIEAPITSELTLSSIYDILRLMSRPNQNPVDQPAPDPGAAGRLTHAEIFRQPELWLTTLERVRSARVLVEHLKRRVILSGAGTSAYAAAAVAAGWLGARAAPTTDLLVATEEEIREQFPGFAENGLLISLARSGDSPESLAVVNRIQRLFPAVEHLGITCNADGRLANLDGIGRILLDPRTNDQSLAMTSSFSNLVLAGLCLRHADEVEQALPEISKRAQTALPHLDAEARRIADLSPSRAVVLASGALTAITAEASLKILEMTAGNIATLADTFLGLRHGPMSFLRPDTLVLCVLSSSENRRRYEEDLLEELRQKQLGHIVAIAPDSMTAGLADTVIPANAPHLRDALRVPFEIPFAQLLAYHLSLRAGLNPDSPSPTGAITRVVQQFRTHEDLPHV
jgi:tagatose-6-phosphate ketose/aldose isomerase